MTNRSFKVVITTLDKTRELINETYDMEGLINWLNDSGKSNLLRTIQNLPVNDYLSKLTKDYDLKITRIR